jgi:hypothetical protein
MPSPITYKKFGFTEVIEKKGDLKIGAKFDISSPVASAIYCIMLTKIYIVFFWVVIPYSLVDGCRSSEGENY